jgi:hypothetical protein
MTYLDESVVQDEHERCSIPRPSLSPKKHLANITYISNLGVSETELPAKLLVSHEIETNRTSYQTMSEVYKTRAATTTVRMRPGTRPKTE